MIRIITPDSFLKVESHSVFLAGSIDMGSAKEWQKNFINEMAYFPITVLNPRNDNWDSSWEQKLENSKFRHQVEWELNHIDSADSIFMFISAESKAPISLLEFGYTVAKFSDKLTICVEEGFWRRGNIEVMCKRHNIKLHDNFQKAMESFKIKIAGTL